MQLSYARLTIAITLATVLFNCIGTPAQPSYDEGTYIPRYTLAVLIYCYAGLYRLADLIENEHNNIKIGGKVTPISPELKIFKGTYEKENIVYSAYITCASKEASSSTLLFYKISIAMLPWPYVKRINWNTEEVSTLGMAGWLAILL
ncbi:hypothetical protein BDF22DRAFT_677989 [Syncephalis plumigaleata]|nr:hypothetical protein BDF22DRAFT_677989 [Syncephalis plumigaleata]